MWKTVQQQKQWTVREPLQWKNFQIMYVTGGSYPEYIKKFQDPETTFTPIICLFNKQGIWHFSNTNPQMSRSTWKTLNILITNQASTRHRHGSSTLQRPQQNLLTLQQDSISNKQNCTEPSITSLPSGQLLSKGNNTYHHTQTQKRSLSEKLEAASHVVAATENNMVAFRTLKLHSPCNPKYPEIFPKNRK